MQIVGMNCSACGKPIGFASEGRACAKCHHACHTACIQGGKICPTCGDDLEHQAAAIEERAKKATAACLSAGRMQFLIATVLLTALMVYNVLASLMRAEFTSVVGFNPLIGMFVTVGLLVAVYAGRFWARVVVGFQLAFGIIVQISVLDRIVRRVGLVGAFTSCWVLLILVVSFILLCFSPSVSIYLESHRAHGTD